MKTKSISLWFLISVFILCLLIYHIAKAECTFVWKPGDVTYVNDHHNVRFIIAAEDIEAYRHQKAIDASLLPSPKMDNAFEESLNQMAHTHACGDYHDITDEDINF